VLYRFGIFEFDAGAGELRKNGRAVAIEPQPAKALALLLARAGDGGGARADGIVSREELRDAVWGADTHVDFDRGLAYCVSQIRTALGDSGENPRFIQTIPKRGFKFIAPLLAQAPQAAPAPALPRAWVTTLSVAGLIAIVLTGLAVLFVRYDDSAGDRVVIAVSVFDNETGNAGYDRPVAGLSDLVVERLKSSIPTTSP